MASDGTSPLPGPDVTMKPGATRSPFTALPFPPPAPGPPDQPPWELPPQPPMPSAFSPGNPLVLSAFPSPLLVTGDGGPGHPSSGAGPVKVKTEEGPADSSQTQNLILAQTALSWIASDTPCGVSEGPPPQFVTATNIRTLLPTKAVGVSQEGLPGLPAQAPPPAAQLAPIVAQEKAWPGPPGASREGGPAAARSKSSLGDLSYTSKGVYENFRRWQRYKALARRHLSQSPDAEAFSCFLIPVLRSLARLKPTMTLEEGLPRAVQEWERTSNFDRMIFYEMAEKFMEFEAEEMQIQNTQLMNGSQGLPPVAPPKLDPPGPLAPEVCQQPGMALTSATLPPETSKARAPRRRQRKTQRPPVPEAPKEIPPEAVKEYADIMEGLVGSHLVTEESDGKQAEEEEQQEKEGIYPDLGLQSYIDELCSQEVFVSQVEAVIHPQFLEDLLSPEQQRDPLALIEELEQEEGLSLAQLVQKRLQALEEEEDGEAPPSCHGAQSDSSLSVSDEDEDGSGRLRPSPGSRVDTCPPNFNSYDPEGEGREDTDLSKPKDLAPSPGNQESYAHETPKSTSPYQGLGSTSPRWGTRDALTLREASPVSETRSSADGAKGKEEEEEEDEELSNFAYLLASKLSLSPRELPLSPRPASGLSSKGRGVQRASHSLSAEARGLGQPPFPVAKSGKRALVGGLASAEKRPYVEAELGGSGEKPLALGVVRPSQPRKRRRDSFLTGRRKKRRRSQ
uniref:NUT midline carcinoma family member 1 n=1 Tax=Equus asinus asinus TaxID=83772 RepID=A0A8C4MEE0_EQUAS